MATLRRGVEWEWGGAAFWTLPRDGGAGGGAVLGEELLLAAILIATR